MTLREQLTRLAQKIPVLRERSFRGRVQARWGTGDFADELESTYWMRSATVREHLCTLATGHPGTDWLTWVKHELLPEDAAPPGGYRCLVLGCGEGWLERSLTEWPSVGDIDAEDIAEDAVAKARRIAEQAGLRISYRTSDLNRDELPKKRYDLIVAHSVLHHLDELEFAFDQIHDALRPGGVVAINEYVGPARLQYTEPAMNVINEIMALLPEHYRISTLTGQVMSAKIRPPVDYLMSVDPSEAARSDELDRVIRERLDVLYEAPLNGSLLQQLLYEIIANFDDDSAHDRTLIRVIAAYEEILHEAQVLEPDFAFYVATRLDQPSTLKLERSPTVERQHFPRPSHGLDQSWQSWPAIGSHLHVVPTNDPRSDWWTFAKYKLLENGITAESPLLVFGESWLEPILRELAPQRVEGNRRRRSRAACGLLPRCPDHRRSRHVAAAARRAAGRAQPMHETRRPPRRQRAPRPVESIATVG